MLGHANRVLGTLTAIVEEEKGADEDAEPSGEAKAPLAAAEVGSLSRRLDEYVQAWNDEEVEKVVGFMRDWVTNARHCFVSAALLNSLVRILGVVRLAGLRAVAEALPGLLSYTERHFARISKLHQGTYIANYMASLMSALPMSAALGDVPAGGGGATASGGSKDARTRKDGVVVSDDVLPVIFLPEDEAESAVGGGESSVPSASKPTKKKAKGSRP